MNTPTVPDSERQIRYEVIESPENDLNSTNIKWMLMPAGKDGVQPAVISGLSKSKEPNVDSVRFFMFSRENSKQAEVRQMNSTCLPVFKHFKPQRKTKVLIHGFGDKVEESIMVPLLRDAFLSRGDFNIIAVDWSELAAKPWYNDAASNTIPVAKHVAKFIDHMSRSTKSKANDFHLIGFSLGAHIVGIASSNVESGKIRHITGLDPAYVLFSSAGPDERLTFFQAELVEVVHTSGGHIGFENPIGYRDFYPNGGLWPQPGCSVDYAAVCSHRRAYYYYAEAIEKSSSFKAVPCTSYKEFKGKKCISKDNETLEMGKTIFDKRYKGSYYLETNEKAPFGKETSYDYLEELENLVN